MSAQNPHPEAALAAEPEPPSSAEHPFYDKALKDYLQRTRMGQVSAEQLNAAAKRYRSSEITANELAQEVLGAAILVGDHYVASGEATKQEVFEVATELIFSVAEETEGEDYATHLAEAMEDRWQEGAGDAEVTRLPIESTKGKARARREHRLVMRYREGDQNAFDELWERYKLFARHLAKSYFIMGAERDDVIAEAQLGLAKAVRDYKPEHGSFRTLAELAMRRQVITGVKTATRQKHGPLNNYLSFGTSVLEGEDDVTLGDMLAGPEGLDPVNVLIEREDLEFRTQVLDDAIGQFSELERQVFEHIQQGQTYEEVAELIEVTAKTVDNALQRVRRKFEAAAMRAERTTFASRAVTRNLESMDMIEQFVTGLSPAEQKVVEAKEAGLSLEEIAIIHGATEEGVELLLRSAGHKLEKVPTRKAA